MRVIFILFILGFGYSGNLAAKEVPVSGVLGTFPPNVTLIATAHR